VLLNIFERKRADEILEIETFTLVAQIFVIEPICIEGLFSRIASSRT
jgi:hypothetical protein